MERDLVGDVVAEVNATEEAKRANLSLSLLRWEDLPPGQTEDHDYQARIDELLERAGLERFEIYVGFLRDRVGTPTPRHASGTIEELETALERRRRTGLPEEVLFYFLASPDSMPPDVEAVRDDLASRGYLFSVAPETAMFRARLHEHLLQVVAGWWRWKNRLRRRLGLLKIVSLWLGALLVLGFLGLDISTLVEVRGEIRGRSFEQAIQTWGARSDYLPLTRWMARAKIEEALVELASERMVESLSSQGFDPFAWEREHLRGFEVAALAAYSRRMITEDPTLRRVPYPLALAVLAEDWSLTRDLLTRESRQGRDDDLAEIGGFVIGAPPAEVVDWLLRDLPSEIPPYVAGRVLDAAAERDEPSVTFAVLDALHSGRLGAEAREFDLALRCEAPVCTESANGMLLRWFRDDEPSPRPALSLLFDWADPERLSETEWFAIEPRLLAIFADSEQAELHPELVGILSTSGSDTARAALRQRLQDYLDGRISYGSAERSALIGALPKLVDTRPAEVALALAKRAAEELEDFDNRALAPSDGTVQAAYLRLLGRVPVLDWDVHRSWVETLLERRLRDDFSDFLLLDVDRSFASLLSALDGQQLLDLFRPTSAPIVDSFDGSLSTRRAYLLDLLAEEPTPLPRTTVDAICRAIPVRQSNRPSFYRALARRGGDAGRFCLATQLVQDPEAIEALGEAGDLETLVRVLPSIASDQTKVDLSSLLAAAERLAPEPRRHFVEAALRVLPKSDYSSLWPLASSIELANAQLRDAAVAELGSAKSPSVLAAAVDHLARVEPSLVWATLGQETASEQFAAQMERFDPFDWIQVAQVLPEVDRGVDPAPLEACLGKRNVLLALESGQVSPGAVLSDRLMSVRTQRVGNPLWRLRVLHSGLGAVDALLRARAGLPDRVDTLGELPEARTVFRAYLDWLLAEVIADFEPGVRRVRQEVDLTVGLGDSNPASRRAWASLTLALFTELH